MTNGERIKNLRTSLKMSRAKFSEHFGIPARTIDDWENERREPSGYVVDMLIKLAAGEKTIPTAWILTEYRDARGHGETRTFTDKFEAIREAEAEWNGLSEHDRADYLAGFAWFYVGLFEMEWDDIDEEFIPKSDPIMIAWDALKK